MKKLFIMYCEDDGEYELWFDENKECVGGYYCNDATWRGEYYDGIFESVGVEIGYLPYNKNLAKKARKQLFG